MSEIAFTYHLKHYSIKPNVLCCNIAVTFSKTLLNKLNSFSTLSLISSLSPFGFDTMTPNVGESNLPWSQEFVPLGAVALFSGCSPDYKDHVNSVVAKANLVYIDFLQSEEGKGFNGQVGFR